MQAINHCTKGIGIWDWASNDEGEEPDVVHGKRGRRADDGSAGGRRHSARALSGSEDPLRQRGRSVQACSRTPSIRTAYPTAISIRLFTKDKPVIFNFHGYPWLIHKLTYRRTNHDNIHVRGYKEKGQHQHASGTRHPNQVDRFNLAIDVIDRVPSCRRSART